MKIYNVVKVPQGLGDKGFYDAIYQSGYTAGYEEGYNSVSCPKRQYCTIEALEDGNISIGNNVEYSINDGDWASAASGDIIAVQAGDITRFKGINAGVHTFMDSSVKCIAYGNVMSLLYGDDFIGKTELESRDAFTGCFTGCLSLTDASNLILPATTLTEYCYTSMFSYCASLTSAPLKLPATTLAKNCYSNMFLGCTSLTTAPSILPATTLAERCYTQMFYECSSLTTAPELPATTLAKNCYYNMFIRCSSLTSVPSILPANTLEEGCYQGMFEGCASLVTPLELPATLLVKNCYQFMLRGCSSLNYIKCLATDISATNCTRYWVDFIAASGTFIKDPNAEWTTGTSGIPENWTVQDAQ